MNVKVVHVITTTGTGGAERMLQKLVEFSSAEISSHVLSLAELGNIGRELREGGVPVTSLGVAKGSYDVRVLPSLVSIIDEINPDVVQGWMYHGNIAALLGCWFSKWSPTLFWNVRHSLHDIRREKWLTRQLVRLGGICSGYATKIIFNSAVSAEQHVAVGYRRDKVKVIPNGFDCTEYVPSPERRRAFRGQLDMEDDEILIGHVARYHPMKDHECFLRAAAILSRSFDNVYFVMAGRNVDGLNGKLQALIAELGLNGKITLLGNRSDVATIMASIDILALSSAWGEAFPNVLGEAMACGTPCVATDVGDARDIIGDTGFIVPTEDDSALASALYELVNGGYKKRRLLGKNARKRIVDKFSLDTIVSRYNKMYLSTISHNGVGALQDQCS